MSLPTVETAYWLDTYTTSAAHHALPEAHLATAHLAIEHALPAWEGECDTTFPPPRKLQAHAINTAVHPAHVEFLTGVNTRGYGAPRRKGKPLSKKLVRQDLVAQSSTKIVITGPDHVGCTTLLQLLGK